MSKEFIGFMSSFISDPAFQRSSKERHGRNHELRSHTCLG